jgi:hypothetical protein
VAPNHNHHIRKTYNRVADFYKQFPNTRYQDIKTRFLLFGIRIIVVEFVEYCSAITKFFFGCFALRTNCDCRKRDFINRCLFSRECDNNRTPFVFVVNCINHEATTGQANDEDNSPPQSTIL